MDSAEMMEAVRVRRPLVVHVTNVVTVNQCANACICAGGSPCMSMSPSDAAELVAAADAVVVNIGTLDSGYTGDAIYSAASAAADLGKPLVIDPAGAGASTIRTAMVRKLLSECVPRSPGTCAVKGNAGEIGFLSGMGGAVRGVDSAGYVDQRGAAEALSHELGCTVASTGPTDIVSGGGTTLALGRGTYMESLVSGTGCMVSSVVGCYVGACGTSPESVAAGITAFNVAAEKAARTSGGPGTFAANLLDCLYSLKGEDLRCSSSTPSRTGACSPAGPRPRPRDCATRAGRTSCS